MTAVIVGERRITPAGRVRWLDGLRGLGLVLMLLDHVLVLVLALGAVPDDLLYVRLTLTRLSLPAFVFVSGWLLATRGPTSWQRMRAIAVWGVALSLLAGATGLFPTPDVLLVLALVSFGLGGLIVRAPIVCLVVCLVWLTNPWLRDALRLWDGYEPALIAMWLCVGVLAARSGAALPAWRERVPAALVTLGSRPLGIYVGHVVVLHLVYVVFK